MSDDAPTNASLDALFAKARSARVATVEAQPRVLAELEAGELPELRAALRIREGGEDFRCMCLGTLSVELRGRLLPLGTLSYHHGVSLRSPGWRSDAWLEDGPGLFRLLAARGVEEPLRGYEREEEARRLAAQARAEWVAAVPRALATMMSTLEGGPGLFPKRPSASELSAALDALRAEHGGDVEVARTLLTWLAAGRGPWSGFASYEELPMHLLRALPVGAVISAATDASLDDASLRAAARHFAAHELVTFAKRTLADVPAGFFERARPVVARTGIADDLSRLEHAARVAEAARRARVPRPPFRIEGGCTVVGRSLDGPLTSLVAHGDALVSCDVRTIVRFDPPSVTPVTLALASESFVVLAAAARVWFATMNDGTVHAVQGDRVVEIAREQRVPVEMAACGERVAWLCRDSPGGPSVAIAHGEEIVRTVSALPAGAWGLALGDTHVLWIEGGWNGGGVVRRAAIDGGEVETLASVPSLGPSMGSPRLVFSEGELLIALPDHVLAIDASGRAARIAGSSRPIRAIAADARHIALVLGEESDRDPPWSIAVLPRAGGAPREVATFARAPYHRHPLVLARGLACTLSGDRVIAAPLDDR